ncbi:hypothetical protein LAY57_05465 [Argonema antarcticum A004/B2]|nr:hypothetical protein [Argonema antarcticum A004/B2]
MVAVVMVWIGSRRVALFYYQAIAFLIPKIRDRIAFTQSGLKTSCKLR